MLSFSFVISPFCNKIYIYVFPIATSHFRICVVVLLYFGDDHTFEFLENFLSLLLFPTPCMLFIYTISFEMSLAVSLCEAYFQKCPGNVLTVSSPAVSTFSFYVFLVTFPFEKASFLQFSIHYIIVLKSVSLETYFRCLEVPLLKEGSSAFTSYVSCDIT